MGAQAGDQRSHPCGSSSLTEDGGAPRGPGSVLGADLGQLPSVSVFGDFPKRSPLLSRHLDTRVGEVKHCLLGIQSQVLVWTQIGSENG